MWLALGYLFAGAICCMLIVTIPFGLASSRIADFARGRSGGGWSNGLTPVRPP
jgi:uncharacterized membrane protein YccF (DUF307 family)